MDTGQAKRRTGSYGPSYRRFGLIGCGVLIAFLLVVFVGILVVFSRSSYYQELMACRENIQRVGDALGRYADKNGAYPDSLRKLVPDYIPATALLCPADKSSVGAITYVYHKVSTSAPESTVLLECSKHKLRDSMPPATVSYLKSGRVVIRTPGGGVITR